MEDDLHDEVSRRLTSHDQRYTSGRRALVGVLADAGRPLTIPEVLDRSQGVPQSTAYRNLTVLIEAGVARRVNGSDDHGRFELAEDLTGHHTTSSARPAAPSPTSTSPPAWSGPSRPPLTPPPPTWASR